VNFGIIVLIILAISIAFGFIFDFTLTQVERLIYPKPSEYAEYVNKYSTKYEVPEEIVWAVIKTESDFDSSAVSNKGAIGLMQMLPDTFEWLSADILHEYHESGMLYHPETNIKYGTYYLSRLYNHFGDWDTAIAAYNGGEGNVSNWMGDDGKLTINEIPLEYIETSTYVIKVNFRAERYKKLYALEQ
jgi:soluble lytic murein transglycosylase